MISRMAPDLYQQARLNVKLTLDKPLTMDEFVNIETAVRTRGLEPMARDASQILDQSQPWQEPSPATLAMRCKRPCRGMAVGM
jgi:hypothetical protein